jgi:hypothetical protein
MDARIRRVVDETVQLLENQSAEAEAALQRVNADHATNISMLERLKADRLLELKYLQTLTPAQGAIRVFTQGFILSNGERVHGRGKFVPDFDNDRDRQWLQYRLEQACCKVPGKTQNEAALDLLEYGYEADEMGDLVIRSAGAAMRAKAAQIAAELPHGLSIYVVEDEIWCEENERFTNKIVYLAEDHIEALFVLGYYDELERKRKKPPE